MNRKIFQDKRRNRIRRGAFVLFFLLSLAVFLFVGCSEERVATVPVMLADVEGVTVVSQNPAQVPFGEDAVFTLEVDESVGISDLPEGATLENGVLTVSRVWFPTTVKISTYERFLRDFSVESSSEKMGEVSSTVENGSQWSDTEVTLTATPKEGFLFLGYSVGKKLDDGGEIVGTTESYTFEVGEGGTVYANFAAEWVDPATTVRVPKNQFVVIYHANGGVLSSSRRDETLTDQFDASYYLCPNTLADKGQFTRDGYVLYGYNTKADGTGTYYGLGWNVVMPERNAISLFCMWAKVSDAEDFTYKREGQNITITKYKGNDEFVVIPETIDGYPVAKINALAFSNRKNMKTLMITKNVRIVEDQAFFNCMNLETLYFCDSVQMIQDAAFVQCDNFSKLYMLAIIYPRYGSSRNGTYAIKYERLITAEGRKLVIASGSNSAYGINSEVLQDEMKKGGHEYSVVNYGQNASTPLTFYLDVISAHVKEGDLVVIAPEINNYQYGYNEINTTLWQIFEGAYDAFSHVDIRNYVKLFSSFTTFNGARNQTQYIDNAYEVYTTDTVNFYGDYSLNKVGKTKDYASKTEGRTSGGYDFNNIKKHLQNYGDELNRALDGVAATGATPLYSFPASNKTSYKTESQVAGGAPQKNAEKAVDELVHATRISACSTYVMDNEYFYNSDYHPTSEGAIIRSKNLAKDIIKYLKSVK